MPPSLTAFNLDTEPSTSLFDSEPSATLPLAPTSAFWPPSNSTSFWDGSGGPALIIVFVAVGLLAGAFAALLIVRRARPRMSMYGGNDSGWFFSSSSPPVLGAEPRLYEAKLDDVKGGVGGGECHWNEIMPLSAKFIPDDAGLEMETPGNPSPAARPSPLSRFIVYMRDYYVPPRPESEDESSDEYSIETRTDEKSYLDSPEDGQLHIAVAIAMPRQSSSLYYSNTPTPSSRSVNEDDLDDKDSIMEVPIAQVPRIASAIQPRRAPESPPEIYLGLAEVRSTVNNAS